MVRQYAIGNAAFGQRHVARRGGRYEFGFEKEADALDWIRRSRSDVCETGMPIEAAYPLATSDRIVARQALTKVRTGNGHSTTLTQCRIQYRVRACILPSGKTGTRIEYNWPLPISE